MDSSSRKSLSMNFNMSDLSVGLSYLRTSYFVGGPKIYNNFDMKSSRDYQSQASIKMSHSLSMNNMESKAKVHIRNNNFLQNIMNIFGSLANTISKIPNYIININRILSLTVNSNKTVICPEYILKNLTSNKNYREIYKESSFNILESLNKNILHNNLYIIEILGIQQMEKSSNEKLKDFCSSLSNNTWIMNIHDPEIDLDHYNWPHLTNNFETKTENNMLKSKGMKFDKKIIETLNSDKINNLMNSKMNGVMNKINTSNNLKTDVQDGMLKETIKMHNHSFDKIDIVPSDSVTSSDSEMLMKKSFFRKTWKKSNIVSRNRTKGRSKVQLRKSGVSQSKHRKERSKHDIYNNIQDDINTWEEKMQIYSKTFFENCNVSASPIVNNKIIDEYHMMDSEYPTLVSSFSLLDQPKSTQKMSEKILMSRSMQSPNNSISAKYNFRTRIPSESSIDSDDSCFIVFQNESESESELESEYSSDSEEDTDDENDRQTNRKVRFTLEPKIHIMTKWDFAYRAARRGPWEEMARDRERFQSRINCISKILNPILMLEHREQIYHNRFDV